MKSISVTSVIVFVIIILGIFLDHSEKSTKEVVVPADTQAHIDSKRDLIVLESPQPLDSLTFPLTVQGKARGYWFFEASFPLVLTDSDGLIIAEGYATAQSDWMTEDFVTFEGVLEFTTPKHDDRGILILKKANASGLPEHDDALEIPVVF